MESRQLLRSEEGDDKVISSWKGAYFGAVQHLIDSHKGNTKLQEAAIRSHAAKSATELDVVVVGLLYRCLTSHSFDTWAFNQLAALHRDGWSAVIKNLGWLVTKRFAMLLPQPRLQLIRLLDELITLNVASIESVLIHTLRHLHIGNLGADNMALARALLELFKKNQPFLLTQSQLFRHVVDKFLRVIPDHHNSKGKALLQAEVDFVVNAIESHFDTFATHGRGLVRALLDVSRLPKIQTLLTRIRTNITSLSHTIKSFDDLLFRPPSRRLLQARISVEMENDLMHMMTKVAAAQVSPYQTTFETKHLQHRGAEAVVPDLIRFICFNFHPDNQTLASNVTPRWQVVLWLLMFLKTNAGAQRSKLALLYDWLFYQPGQIMLIEPGMLLMAHAARSNPSILATLAEFLALVVQNFVPSLKDSMVDSVTKAVNDAESLGVVKSLIAVFGQLEAPILRLLESTFPTLLFRALAFDEEDRKSLTQKRAAAAAAKAVDAAKQLAKELTEEPKSEIKPTGVLLAILRQPEPETKRAKPSAFENPFHVKSKGQGEAADVPFLPLESPIKTEFDMGADPDVMDDGSEDEGQAEYDPTSAGSVRHSSGPLRRFDGILERLATAATDDLKEIYDALLFKLLGTSSTKTTPEQDFGYVLELVSLLRASVQVALDMVVFPTTVEATTIASMPLVDLGPLSTFITFVAQSDVADFDTLPVYAVYLQLRASEQRLGAILLLQLLHDGTSYEDITRVYQGFNSPQLATAFDPPRSAKDWRLAIAEDLKALSHDMPSHTPYAFAKLQQQLEYHLAGSPLCLQAALQSATASFHLDLAYAINHTPMRWILPPESQDQAELSFEQVLEVQSASIWKVLVASITWEASARAGLAALLSAEGALWDELLILQLLISAPESGRQLMAPLLAPLTTISLLLQPSQDTCAPVFELPSFLAYVRARVLCQWIRRRPADLVQAMVGHLEQLSTETTVSAPTLPFLDGWQSWLKHDVQPNSTFQPLVEGVLSSSSLREALVAFFNAGPSAWRETYISILQASCVV
eukprot:m.143216 g.143216  ORF g.143216 m.143216 type:complete len:1038 (-) comp16172_c0_seq3:41-3154(-)